MSFSVDGGQIQMPKLTNKLSEKDYSVGKVVTWLNMLNDMMKPVRWLKANSKGTKINFKQIKSQEEYDSGLAELEGFITEVNEKYGTDLSLNKK